MNFNSANGILSVYDKNPERSNLVQYGEQVFRKENCIECHTLRIENETSEQISLDGYSGKRSTPWLYQLVKAPKAIIIGLDNHNFAHLLQTNLSKPKLKNILTENGNLTETELNEEWIVLKSESDSISVLTLDLYSPVQAQTEVFALIAFLQHIPTTSKKQKQLDIIELRRQQELNRINELYRNSDSLIQATLAEPKSIERGKLLFNIHCKVCHGPSGEGYIGVNLTDDYWLYGGESSDLIKTITNGSPTNKMPSHSYKFTPKDVAEVVSYLIQIKGTNVAGGSSPQGIKE